MRAVFIVRAVFWLLTSALAIAAMASKKGLCTVSYTVSLPGLSFSIDGDVGMFKTKGSVYGDFVQSNSSSLDTTDFFDAIGLDAGYAKLIQGFAMTGLSQSTLGFAVCVFGYVCATGCSGVCLKAISLLLDIMAALCFGSAAIVILITFHMTLAPSGVDVGLALSDMGDRGPAMTLLSVCALLAVISSCLTCCVSPRRTEVPEDHALLRGSDCTNTARHDYGGDAKQPTH